MPNYMHRNPFLNLKVVYLNRFEDYDKSHPVFLRMDHQVYDCAGFDSDPNTTAIEFVDFLVLNVFASFRYL